MAELHTSSTYYSTVVATFQVAHVRVLVPSGSQLVSRPFTVAHHRFSSSFYLFSSYISLPSISFHLSVAFQFTQAKPYILDIFPCPLYRVNRIARQPLSNHERETPGHATKGKGHRIRSFCGKAISFPVRFLPIIPGQPIVKTIVRWTRLTRTNFLTGVSFHPTDNKTQATFRCNLVPLCCAAKAN